MTLASVPGNQAKARLHKGALQEVGRKCLPSLHRDRAGRYVFGPPRPSDVEGRCAHGDRKGANPS